MAKSKGRGAQGEIEAMEEAPRRRNGPSFLKESGQAPWKLPAAKRHTNQLKKDWARADRSQAEAVHEVGTQLLIAHSAKVWEAFGLTSFAAWLREKVGVPERTAYRYMLVAAFASGKDTSLGLLVCERGARLCVLLGKRSLSDLRKVDLTLPDGSKVRFPQPLRILDAALKLLGDEEDADVEVESGAEESVTRREVSAIVDEELASMPELGRFFRVSMHRGQVSVRLQPVPVAAVGEVAKALNRIARRLGS